MSSNNAPLDGTSDRDSYDRRALALGFLLCLGAACLIVGLHVHRYTTLSPIDELQHFDYLEKASRGQLVRPGERVGQEAMREESCRGIDAAFNPPPCTTETFDPNVFQELGYNTAASQSPIYYAVSGVVARGVAAIAGLESLLTAARLTGAAWLALGGFLTGCLARRLGASRSATGVLVGIVMLSPVVLHATATVNVDAVLLAAGAGVLLLADQAERRRGWTLTAFVAASVVAFLLEPTTMLAIGVAMGYLGLRFLSTGEATRERLVRCTVLVAAVVTSLYLAYRVTGQIRSSLALDVGQVQLPKDAQFATTSVSNDQVLNSMGSLMTPLRAPYLPNFLNTPSVRTVVQVTEWLLLGSLIGTALFSKSRTRVEAMSFSLVVAGIASGPLLILYNFRVSSAYFAIPSRYGLSFVPGIAAVAAASLQKRSALAAGGTLLVVTTACVLTRLV